MYDFDAARVVALLTLGALAGVAFTRWQQDERNFRASFDRQWWDLEHRVDALESRQDPAKFNDAQES